MEDYMESEFTGIFQVKLVAKNIMFGSRETHFMHMRVKQSFLRCIYHVMEI